MIASSPLQRVRALCPNLLFKLLLLFLLLGWRQVAVFPWMHSLNAPLRARSAGCMDEMISS